MKTGRRRFGAGTRHLGRPPKLARRLPSIRRKDLPTVNLPKQSRRSGGKTKLTNHRAAMILHAIGSGCYRETAAELAGSRPRRSRTGCRGRVSHTRRSNASYGGRKLISKPEWWRASQIRPTFAPSWRWPSLSGSFRSVGPRSRWWRRIRPRFQTSTLGRCSNSWNAAAQNVRGDSHCPHRRRSSTDNPGRTTNLGIHAPEARSASARPDGRC
jgi:hypothetical protein